MSFREQLFRLIDYCEQVPHRDIFYPRFTFPLDVDGCIRAVVRHHNPGGDALSHHWGGMVAYDHVRFEVSHFPVEVFRTGDPHLYVRTVPQEG